MLEVVCANLQTVHAIDEGRLADGVRRVMETAGIFHGEISLTVVGNEQMHQLNRQHLDHDYPTDVLSFLLERRNDWIEGEIIVSADYAAAEATQHGWEAKNELTLYVVHGALHLVGYDDTTADTAAQMRAQERAILGTFGLSPPGR